jgi:diacylglycerol O-acyltransferase / wax synthase
LERVTPEDLTSLATDTGPASMQVGAILVLDTAAGFDLQRGTGAIAERIRSVPRLRQRLVPVPFGCGRPVWTDDTAFDIAHHVQTASCPGAGDDDALLAFAADLIGTRLPGDRPLWSATFVAGLTGERTALVVIFHHVLADGIGGLAVLANLVDGAPVNDATPDFPRPAPSRQQIAFDAFRERARSIARAGERVREVRAAIAELRSARPSRPSRSSLNRPTGSRRRFAFVRADLERAREVAHAHGATVNDVVLTAVTAALRDLLASRGETVDRFVVSVPVSARREAGATELGNRVGVVPVELPATGEAVHRLDAIATITRIAKRAPRAASAAVLGPVFRLLARLGLFHWFIDRQRFVNTFVTNLRGPSDRLAFLGAPITDVLPVAIVTGNVTVSFAVLSYAGTLGVTIIADSGACPDLPVLAVALRSRLDEVTRSGFSDRA